MKNKAEILQYMDQGEEIRLLRRLMGVKAGEIAKRIGQGQGNYSKMESGYLKNTNVLVLVRLMYNEWCEKEIISFHKRIEYLKSLIK
jgi:transcriptional regulator with XRE-family HTH domain